MADGDLNRGICRYGWLVAIRRHESGVDDVLAQADDDVVSTRREFFESVVAVRIGESTRYARRKNSDRLDANPRFRNSRILLESAG
jgi:hypothetical protein